MKTVLFAACLAIALAGAGAPGWAQDTRSAQSPSRTADSPAARLAAARDLMLAMDVESGVRSVLAQSLLKAEAQANSNSPMTRQQRQAIRNAIQAENQLTAKRIVAEMASAYAQRFTVAELRAIAAFYRSPAGRKLQSEEAEMQAELSRKMEAITQEHVMGVIRRLLPHLRELEGSPSS